MNEQDILALRDELISLESKVHEVEDSFRKYAPLFEAIENLRKAWSDMQMNVPYLIRED